MINNTLANSPIGVFDSGLGGLTVLKSLSQILPNESFIYFGDTAHVPYGTKSAETIIKYSKDIINFFSKYQTKAVVIACNTASAIAFKILQVKYKIPIFDVVTPSVEFCINNSKNNTIGVIGTSSTVQSKAYTKMFKNLKSKCLIKEIACPLFVPLIEEGWVNSEITMQIAQKYLKEFDQINIDTLILGCTHYPIIADIIQKVISKNINLVFSGETVGNKLKSFLEKNHCKNSSKIIPNIKYFVSDSPEKFSELGGQFLGEKIDNVKHISII